LRELINKKMKGQKVVAPHEEVAPGGAKVIDLMAALRKSIGEGGKGKAKPRPKAKRAASGGRTKTKAKTTRKRASG
jgi:DNA end-binding protein Ku